MLDDRNPQYEQAEETKRKQGLKPTIERGEVIMGDVTIEYKGWIGFFETPKKNVCRFQKKGVEYIH